MPVTPTQAPSFSPRGAEQFRRLLQIFAIALTVTFAIASIASYVSYLRLAGAGHEQNPYAVMRQKTTLTYYAIWFGVALLALAASFQKKYPMLAPILLVTLFIEGGAFGLYFAKTHRLYEPIPRVLSERFESHPLLIAKPRPGEFGAGVSHDAEHRRTTINLGKVAAPKEIYVFGGSTVYELGNSDEKTWPSRLSALLGSDFAVQNYGIPAYSSLENMIQSLFAFRDHAPVCAIYYLGANDLRNSHVQNLSNDYSEMELPHIINYLQPARPRGFLETYSVFFAFVGTLFAPPPPSEIVPGQVSDQQDMHLSRIYQDNIGLIAAIGRQFGVRVIFIPHVMNYARLTEDRIGHLPFIKEKDTKKLMTLLNEDLAHAAAKSGAAVIDAPLSVDWVSDDFFDDNHFDATGADKFARSIVEDVRRTCE